MMVLDIGRRFKHILLVLLLSFLILLFACGGGVSQEEFDAEQARVQDLEVQVQTLQQRLDRGATITGVLDTLTISFEGGPSAEALLQITAMVQATGDSALLTKWREIGESVQASTNRLRKKGVSVKLPCRWSQEHDDVRP